MSDDLPDFDAEIGITKYERARMLGSRALQIAMGAPFLVELPKEELDKIRFNPIEIVKREFEAGVLPITIRRPAPKPMPGAEGPQAAKA